MSESAILRTGSRQFRVRVGDVLDIPNVRGEPGGEVTFDQVLLHEAEGAVHIGSPTVEGVTVVADILGQIKGPKINGFKFKPKKHYSRSFGHRQQLTKVRIKEIATA